MEPQPTVRTSLGEVVHTKTVFNQCTSSVAVQTHTVLMPTTVPVTVCPSSTSSHKSQIKGTTNICNQYTNTATVTVQTCTPVQVTVCPSSLSSLSTTYLPTSETHAPTAQTVPSIELYATASAIGALVVLLLAVISGWVCTCRNMKKRGKMEINIMQDRYIYCLVRDCINIMLIAYKHRYRLVRGLK